METKLLEIIPVLPSNDLKRDIDWYHDQTGFEWLSGDNMYAVLKRQDLHIHLQWHADTDDDPLLGGSVTRLFVNNIHPVFNEFVNRGTVKKDDLRINTPWNTHEFGFYDLNKNAIFIAEVC